MEEKYATKKDITGVQLFSLIIAVFFMYVLSSGFISGVFAGFTLVLIMMYFYNGLVKK